MEVHPPHHAVLTWRDFFVHMATIVLGLLIAIGLEQSVEALHHRHQLREMRVGLREDAERNLHSTELIHTSLDAESDWVKARIGQVSANLRNHVSVGVPPERAQTASWDAPMNPTWLAAKSSGLLEVVPPDEVKTYTEIDGMIAVFSPYMERFSNAAQKRISFEAAFCGSDCAQGPDLAQASPEELRQYIMLLQDEQNAIQSSLSLMRWIHGATEAFLNGETRVERIQAAEHQPWRER